MIDNSRLHRDTSPSTVGEDCLNVVLLPDHTLFVSGGALKREFGMAARLQSEIYDPFNEALTARDVRSMMSLMTETIVFENTYPAPDGTRYESQAAVREFWEAFFRSSAVARIDIEEIFAWQDRCVMRWVYRWVAEGAIEGHIRGVDLYRVEGGLIAEKLSYVKG